MSFEFTPTWEEVSKADFRNLFLQFIGELETRLIKFEFGQEYSEPGDPSYEAFLRGDLIAAQKELKSRIAGQRDLYQSLLRKDVSFTRVRYVEKPFSDYLNYELLSYPFSAAFGERIAFVERGDVKEETLSSRYFRDCLIFDTRAVLINKLDDNGTPDGGYFSRSSYDIEAFLDIYEDLIASSTTLADQIYVD